MRADAVDHTSMSLASQTETTRRIGKKLLPLPTAAPLAPFIAPLVKQPHNPNVPDRPPLMPADLTADILEIFQCVRAIDYEIHICLFIHSCCVTTFQLDGSSLGDAWRLEDPCVPNHPMIRIILRRPDRNNLSQYALDKALAGTWRITVAGTAASWYIREGWSEVSIS